MAFKTISMFCFYHILIPLYHYADDNEKKVKTIYRFHKLVFDIGESRLEHVNRASQNYELWPPVPVRYRSREKRFLSLSLTRRGNERWGMHVPWMFHDWFNSVCFRNSYIFTCYFIHHEGESWSWSYGSWIYNYVCNQYLSRLKLWAWTSFLTICTRYNIIWRSLIVICDKPVVFSGYSCFLYQ